MVLLVWRVRLVPSCLQPSPSNHPLAVPHITGCPPLPCSAELADTKLQLAALLKATTRCGRMWLVCAGIPMPAAARDGCTPWPPSCPPPWPCTSDFHPRPLPGAHMCRMASRASSVGSPATPRTPDAFDALSRASSSDSDPDSP